MRSPTAEEQRILQRLVDNVHGQFVAAVALGRQMPEEAVRAVADGRLYSGAEALEIGLVDELGGYEEAIRIAARAAGIEGEPRTIRAEMRRRFRLLEWLGQVIGLDVPGLVHSDLPDGLLFLHTGGGRLQ